ncbi:MAG: hypothetical protein EOO14_01280 [Chitinophagaceae bacterium]|nr:MAG: hypothetical protein EOO14_01280 [Chitinophagaceae bacterium]
MKTTITSCFLLLTFVAIGQIRFQSKTVQPALHLKKDETHVVSILHSKTKSEKGKQPESSSLRYTAAITVIDSTEDEFTFRWAYQIPKAGSAGAETMAYMKLIAALELVYKTDGTGGFKELVNWEKVRDFYLKIVEESIPRKGGDSTNVALEKVKAMFSTKAAVQGAFVKEIQLLHSVYGQRFSTQLEKSATFMSVPIADEPVPAMVTAQVTALTPTQYTIQTSQSIDKTGAAKMFEQMFRKMGVNDEKALEGANAALAGFQMSDKGSYTIHTKTGLPIKAVYTRTGGTADILQLETYELSVK